MLKKKCIGCGVELQFEDKTKEGYVPEEKFVTKENLLVKDVLK